MLLKIDAGYFVTFCSLIMLSKSILVCKQKKVSTKMDNYHPNIFVLKSDWNGIKVRYCHMKAKGDFPLAMPQHGVSIAFAPHDRAIWSLDGRESQTSPVLPGSTFIHTNRNFVWHYREKISDWVDLELEPQVLIRIAKESNLSTDLELEHRVFFSDPTVLHLAQLFKAEVIKSGIAENIYIESLRNLLAVHLIRNYSSISYVKRSQFAKQITEKARPLDILRVQQLQDFIEENLDQKLTLEKLAATVHLSQFHFARAFTRAMGITPHRYITQRRLERAKILLGVTRLSIQEIAIKVGYANKSHFTAQFRKYVGATPAVYRNTLKY